MKTDPKPNLGPAAIQSNIEYYMNIESKLADKLLETQAQREYWQDQLSKLKTPVTGFGVPAGNPSQEQQWGWYRNFAKMLKK